ncbi:MAG: hypothetical protein U0228_22450 [Myxococcaceae bacterium]
MPKKPPTVNELRWDIGVVQKKLKKLKIPPPPPKGQPEKPDIMKPGKFYTVPLQTAPLTAYLAQLNEVLDAAASKWTLDAFGHSVMAAALEAAPEAERLAKPHRHVPSKPVIDNHGYVALAMLAAEVVTPFVPQNERKSFARWLELGQRVLARRELTASDVALLDEAMPVAFQPSGASARAFGPASDVMRIAHGVGWEAEQADHTNVGGKGAREACAKAVAVLASQGKPGDVRRFLERLDALLLTEDARLQLEKVAQKPSAPLKAGRWRGAEKGKTALWLVELEGGRFALLWKLKGQWRFVEGAKEDVLASVPDAHMASAVEALL